MSALLQYEGIRLFLERARLAQSGFALTSQNARAMVQICHRLDGVPLAIELAAARLKVLSVEEIAARLHDRFRLLAGGSRTAPLRQQSLRASVDCSYILLSDAERALFDRLSVFAGGWTLDAAEAVCGDASGDAETRGRGDAETGAWEPLAVSPCRRVAVSPCRRVPAPDVLDWLSRLVDKSLVVAEVGVGGATRYRLLETLRQYAQERLAARGAADVVRRRHAACFLALAERAEPELLGPEQPAWMRRLEREHENLREALRWCVESGEAEMGLRLGGALWRFWFTRGHLSEGREWLERLLALPAGAARTAARAKGLNGAGNLAHNQGDWGAARAFHEESLAIRRELDDRSGIAASLNNLGLVYMCLGQYAAATARYEEALALARALGQRTWEAIVLNNLGRAAFYQGGYEAARALHEQSLAIERALGDKWGMADSLSGLGDVAHARGDYAAARARHEESLALFQELGDRAGIAQCLDSFAGLAAAQGQPERAVRLLAAAAAVREANGYSCAPVRQAALGHLLEAARQESNEEAYAAAWAEGRGMTPAQAIEHALAGGVPADLWPLGRALCVPAA